MYSYSRGVIESMKSLYEVKRISEKIYEKSPAFLEYSPSILLGALYAEAPWFPIAFGNIEKAGRYYLEAIQMAPNNTTAYIFLSRLYFRTGSREKGYANRKRILEILRRKSRNTLGEKDLDFWWHVDRVRAIMALKAYKDGFSNSRNCKYN